MSREIGALAEQKAARFLEGLGYEVLERNFRAKVGEIDIIARDGETVVFVEVRARKSNSFGLARETVGAFKRRKLIKTAMIYAQRRGFLDCAMRFDVIAIEAGTLEHFPNAFDSSGL